MHYRAALALPWVLLGGSICLADEPPEAPAPAHPVPAVHHYEPRVSCLACPSDTGHYIGYYVGGGCGRPHKAEGRSPNDGTWGWDYRGWLIPRRVVLGWWHGRRYQGGTGAYKTDGRHLYHPEHEEQEHHEEHSHAAGEEGVIYVPAGE